MFTFTFTNWFSSEFLHPDPLKKAAKRAIARLNNNIYVVLDRILDDRFKRVDIAEALLANAQKSCREAEEFFRQEQYARAIASVEEGLEQIKKLIIPLPFDPQAYIDA